MENKNELEVTELSMDAVVSGIEKIVNSAVDVSKETDKIISLTPSDGYQKKIELIMNADDMSTTDKIKAIDAAEDKRFSDLSHTADMCKDMMWTKTGTVLICTAAIVLLIASPDGRKIATNILKRVA